MGLLQFGATVSDAQGRHGLACQLGWVVLGLPTFCLTCVIIKGKMGLQCVTPPNPGSVYNPSTRGIFVDVG